MGLPQSFVSPDEQGDGAGHAGAWRSTRHGGHNTPKILFAVPADPPQYCPMLAVDIQAFNGHGRGDDAQRFLRAAMYSLLAQAFDRSGLPWSACHHEDRGDGVLMIAPSGVPTTTLIDPLADYLRAGLRSYNKFCNDLARISLRASVHAGQVYFDENGVCGQSVTLLFRMLDADEFKRALAESGSDFALVSSETVYQEIISPAPGLIDPEMYAPIDLKCKETRTRAWLYLPPVRHPFLRRVNSPEVNGRGVNGRGVSGRGVNSRERQRRSGVEPELPGEGETRPSGRPTQPFPGSGLIIPLPDRRRDRPRQPKAKQYRRQPATPGPSIRDNISSRARLIAANAVTRSRQLAAVPRSSFVHARVRELRYPRQRVQHV